MTILLPTVTESKGKLDHWESSWYHNSKVVSDFLNLVPASSRWKDHVIM